MLLPTRHLRGIAVSQILQLHHIQYTVNFLFDISLIQSADREWKGQIFSYGHMWEEGIILENHTDPPLVRGQVMQGFITQRNLALSGGFKPG
ncbi:hypothetical [Yersinia pestis KIM10+]|uniref:Uncharacterized protein n=1 Tax=Yersinia pestis TaxID=632 RepID=Q8CLG6_YERPE|nr:hypothetical [Yersinia pestis KIM10+]